VSRKKKIFIGIAIFFVVAVSVGGYFGYGYYKMIFDENVNHQGKETYIYIATGSEYDDVLEMLKEKNIIMDAESFDWVARQMNYDKMVKPGRYLISGEISSNKDLVALLRSGKQSPVKVKINNIRNFTQLAGKVSGYIEADSLELFNILISPEITEKYGFTRETFLTMFIPDTYEFYWNTSAEQFIERMAEEYKNFWTQTRKAKAAELGFSQSQVSTLASIVQEEQNKFSGERPIIAGLYINRIRQGMPLQADPTLKFAWNDFSIKRVLDRHKEINSPYNTYKNAGLPPGPICLPEVSSIDAVLNYEQHDYIYMCAKEDFSGYHNFAKTYQQHLINARKYQEELNRRGIK